MSNLKTILNVLSDGKFHSGEALGKELGITRSAVWKTIKKLHQLGLEVHTLPRKGYRVPHGFELLNEERIRSHLENRAIENLTDLEIIDVVDSTNDYLLAKENKQSGQLILAERQTAGRGRQGRVWESPFGVNIYLSMTWQFKQGASALAGLSIATGVAVVKALEKYGVKNVGIKWPNDIVHNGKKLAGILLDVTGDAAGPCHVVLGIGMNLRLSQYSSIKIDQPWTDIETITSEKPERNKIVALLINELLTMLPVFEQQGLQPFINEWQQLDTLKDKKIIARSTNGELSGLGAGLDDKGHLLLNIDHRQIAITSGNVSVRLDA